MIIAYQIVLILVIIITLLGAIGEREDQKLRENCVTLCLGGMASFIITSLLL